MTTTEPIVVTSHVARDFLQNAAYFNTYPKIVWEYVSNSLDAAKDDQTVIVVVEITSQKISVADNGRGMSRRELINFFQMHGENIQRKRGKTVRGRFGTGKCAAFGLANRLRIDTSQNGRRNVVELHRSDIEEAHHGQPFPVREIIRDEPTDAEDGTIVEIRDFIGPRPNVDQIIAYVERHLSRYHRAARVIINGHLCQFSEPPYTEVFERVPPSDIAQVIGQVHLVIKISPVPLDEEMRGIDILSHGIWHETTLAGIEKREYSNYIFGYVDVPLLEDGDWKIPAFDNTRNNILNRQNPVVTVLLGWLSIELEEVRKRIAERERQRRESEMAKQLAKEAQRISSILNQDFAQQELELELTRKVSRRSGGRSVGEILDDEGELWPGQGTELTEWQDTGPAHGHGKHAELTGEGEEPRPGPTARPGDQLGARKSLTNGTSKKRRAIFSIDYEHATAERPRSRYDSSSKTIYINLDHPQIARALEAGGNRTDSRQFREICFEVAAVEYAIALPYEKLERSEGYYAPEDALFDVKETIDRVIKRLTDIME
ncbi:MAG: ATP-binding protein [Nitrososphaerota archaeon]